MLEHDRLARAPDDLQEATGRPRSAPPAPLLDSHRRVVYFVIDRPVGLLVGKRRVMLSKFMYAGRPGPGRLGAGMWLWGEPPCQTAAHRLAPEDRAPACGRA